MGACTSSQGHLVGRVGEAQKRENDTKAPREAQWEEHCNNHESPRTIAPSAASTPATSPLVALGGGLGLSAHATEADDEDECSASVVSGDISFSDVDLGVSIIVQMTEVGDYRKVRLLIEADEDVNSSDKDGNTCLHVAAQQGHADIAWLLLSNSAEISRRNILEDTPLHDASRRGSLKVVKMLLEAGADVSAVNCDSETPLHLAVKSRSAVVVSALLARGAEVDAAIAGEVAALQRSN